MVVEWRKLHSLASLIDSGALILPAPELVVVLDLVYQSLLKMLDSIMVNLMPGEQ
jgi:hypothetical protein